MLRNELRQSRRERKLASWILLGVATLSISLIGYQGYRLYQYKCAVREVQGRIEALQRVHDRLEEEKRQLGEPRYVEKIARDEYNMVGKNEVPIVIVEEEKKKS